MSEPDKMDLKELDAITCSPNLAISDRAPKRNIPETVLHMHACPVCFAGTMAVVASFLLIIFGIGCHQFDAIKAPMIFVAISFISIIALLWHTHSHFRHGRVELSGLSSSSLMPIQMVDHIERWLVTHPIVIGRVETPWRSVKAIKEHSRGRVAASLVIPVECRTMLSGVSPNIDKELNLKVDATKSSSGGTDIKITVEFTAIDQDQSYRTIAAVVSGVVTSVVMQEVALIGGSSTSVSWFIPEPIHSRDDVKFRARVKGTLTMGPVNDANAEKRLEYALHEIELAIHICSTQIDSSVLRSDSVPLKAAAAVQIGDMSLPQNCSFELDDIELEVLESKLPMAIKEKPVIHNDL